MTGKICVQIMPYGSPFCWFSLAPYRDQSQLDEAISDYLRANNAEEYTIECASGMPQWVAEEREILATINTLIELEEVSGVPLEAIYAYAEDVIGQPTLKRVMYCENEIRESYIGRFDSDEWREYISDRFNEDRGIDSDMQNYIDYEAVMRNYDPDYRSAEHEGITYKFRA